MRRNGKLLAQCQKCVASSEVIKIQNSQVPKLPSSHAPNLPRCQVAKLPSCQVAKMPSCQVAKLPSCQVAKWTSCQVAKFPSCPVTKMPSSQVSSINQSYIINQSLIRSTDRRTDGHELCPRRQTDRQQTTTDRHSCRGLPFGDGLKRSIMHVIIWTRIQNNEFIA